MTDKSKQQEWMQWLLKKGACFLLFARQQTRSEADAKDVFQDAVIKLWKRSINSNLNTVQRSNIPEDAHLFAAIRQCAIDLARKENRRLYRETKISIWIDDSNEDWFQHQSEDEEHITEMKALLLHLDAKYQEVLTLKIWGQLTFSRIGEVLGISANTAASRYRYGLQALRKKMKVPSK